jgi:hypothetical protein
MFRVSRPVPYWAGLTGNTGGGKFIRSTPERVSGAEGSVAQRGARLVLWRRIHLEPPKEEHVDKSETKSPVANDVLQSDHHVQMSEEEISKARAHHNKRHNGENPQNSSAKAGQDKKKIPVKPR